MSGKVERLHANIGDEVRKGQVIAELEKADLEARFGQRGAELRIRRIIRHPIRSAMHWANSTVSMPMRSSCPASPNPSSCTRKPSAVVAVTPS